MVTWVGLQCVVVVFPDQTHLLLVFLFFCIIFLLKSINIASKNQSMMCAVVM